MTHETPISKPVSAEQVILDIIARHINETARAEASLHDAEERARQCAQDLVRLNDIRKGLDAALRAARLPPSSYATHKA